MQLHHHLASPIEDTLRKALRLVDDQTGVIKILHEAPCAPDSPRIFGCGALSSDYSRFGFPSESPISGSTSLVRDQALVGAIGEAVERYSAAYVPYDEIIYRPISAVSATAVSPWSLSLYDEVQLARAGFGYCALRPDDTIGWVMGFSLTRKQPILVPAFAVYQPYISRAGEMPVVQQITTGLACGNTAEEAILSAICEVVERDAAMLMWLQSRRPPKTVIESRTPKVVRETLARFGPIEGHVTLLDVTTDLAIPAYIAVSDVPMAGKPGATFSSCANLVASRAAVGALTELAQCLLWVNSLVDKGTHLPNPSLEDIAQIEEHVLWPLLPENRQAFEFVLSSSCETEIPQDHDWPTDILDSITHCVERIARAGLEVVVVDVTSPDIRECGLHVFRAIIPGAQPLYFGSGLHRISVRATSAEYADRASKQINLHPHPFP